jgi:multidrug efflux pump subunit AcrA (membrane-fusion protein)
MSQPSIQPAARPPATPPAGARPPAPKGPPPRTPEESDREFMSDARAAVMRDARPLTLAVLYCTAIFLVIAVGWASWATLDEVVVGTGKVIPSSQIQVIQNLEGGILAELTVAEGQVVNKDQVLLRIDDTRFTSSYREAQVKRLALLASIARLTAETQGTPLSFPREVVKASPHLVRSETALYQSRRRAVNETVAGLKRSYELASRELKMSESLVPMGAISEVEILRLRRQVNELQTNIDERTNRYRAEAGEELAKNASELATLDESTVAMEDRVKRTVVRSPVRGIVKKLNFTTPGAVLQPGAPIMEIVPLEDTLLVEAQVRPDDIAFIHPGQAATVKLTAYDFSIYGGLKGNVELVSADSMLDDKKGVTYYKVLARTQSATLDFHGKALPIIPGMTAQVDILTGRKTVLDYLLKPVLKTRERAMRER